jgi:tetratricopeptide (TPR) repeat protein
MQAAVPPGAEGPSVRAEYDRAIALGAAGDDAGAEAALRDLLDRYPDHRGAAATLAHFLAGNARPGAAADVVVRGFERRAFGPIEAATFLRRCQRFEAAYRVCESALESRPDDSRLRSIAGTIALNLGFFGEAFEHLAATVAAAPDDAAAWLRIAHTRRFEHPDDPALALLEDAAQRLSLPVPAREAIGFALGKACDDLGRYADAAMHMRAANASYRARVPWPAVRWQGEVERLLALRWPARWVAMPESRFVFVVGLPRSGTTLAASLIERQLGARNRGETPWVSEAARMLGDPPHRAEARTEASAFLARQLRQDDEPARHYLDKNPLNFRHVGLIRALLPQSKIIWMLRDLRDAALSTWMQHFAHPDTGYAYAWSDIAAFFEGHARLLEVARRDAADAVMFLRYEDLVGDTAETLRRVAAFIDAEPVAAAASRESGIATASLWQARQSIHTGSIGRWRNYRELIPELSERFAER